MKSTLSNFECNMVRLGFCGESGLAVMSYDSVTSKKPPECAGR